MFGSKILCMCGNHIFQLETMPKFTPNKRNCTNFEEDYLVANAARETTLAAKLVQFGEGPTLHLYSIV